jgi:UDP-4-amino-4,6-dideoxy-N-acetyl-beta-L-altrosamine N-acetyltransferase
MDVKLVPLAKDEIELVRTWRNSDDVAKYMYTETKISRAQQNKWFESIQKRNDCKYWIIEYDNRKLGLASLTGIDRVLQSCYWAFYLGDRSIRGAGVGSKVEYNVLVYVFEELKLNKLRCEVLVENSKVIRMHEKFGFRREAYYREHCMKNDRKLDVVGLAILKKEWYQLKNEHYLRQYSVPDQAAILPKDLILSRINFIFDSLGLIPKVEINRSSNNSLAYWFLTLAIEKGLFSLKGSFR